jgi:hypothetical protein
LQKICPMLNEIPQVQAAALAVPMLGLEVEKLANSSTKCCPLKAPRSLVEPVGNGAQGQHCCEMLVHVTALEVKHGDPQLVVSQKKPFAANPDGQVEPHTPMVPQVGGTRHWDALLPKQGEPQLESQNKRTVSPGGQLPQVLKKVRADVASLVGSSPGSALEVLVLGGGALQPFEPMTRAPAKPTARHKRRYVGLSMFVLSFFLDR